MRKIVLAVAAAVGLAMAGPAEAQFAFDLKLAYAIPMGNIAQSTLDSTNVLSDSISGALPIGIDARYRFTKNWSAGLYFQYAPAFPKNCPTGVSCSASNLRLGVEAVYGFLPDGGMNPWVSLGTGWEWLNGSISRGSLKQSSGFNGWEYFNVQVGLDFQLAKMFGLGPYVGFSGGSYGSVSFTDIDGTTTSGSIANTAFHSWFQFGVKGTLDI